MLVLLVSGLAGGGRGGLGDTAAQLLSLPLFALLAWFGIRRELDWQAPTWVRCLPLLALALPLLQLCAVPEALWSLGPARAELAQQLRMAGVASPRVLSLDPAKTEAAFVGLLPGCAIFLAALVLERRWLWRLLAVVALLVLLNVFLGMAQLGQGRSSPLRLYDPTNADSAVGLFANRNHLASLLAMCLPLALGVTAWGVGERVAGRRGWPLLVAGGCVLVVLMVLGIAMSGSRGGLLLGMLAVLGAWPISMTFAQQRGARRLLTLALAAGVLLAIQFSMVGVLQRIGGDAVEDGRWEYARVTSEAAAAYLPWGSGLGTFRQAYQPFEAKAEPGRVIINHAHDDYLELWLEGGVPALLLLAAGIGAWCWRGLVLARQQFPPGAELQAILLRSCWLAGTISLLHSALDYPLRNTAILVVFALVAAIAYRNVEAIPATAAFAAKRPRPRGGRGPGRH